MCALSWAWSRGSVAWRVVTMLSNCGVWKVELWSRGLILQRFLSRTISTLTSINLGYLTLHTTAPCSLFAGVDYLLPGLDCQITLLVIAKTSTYARRQLPAARVLVPRQTRLIWCLSLCTLSVAGLIAYRFYLSNVSTHIVVFPDRAHKEHRICRTGFARQ